MSFSLGFQPERLTVKLSRFGDFVSALIYDDGDPAVPNAWPVDANIELRFYTDTEVAIAGAAWPALIVGDRASWHIPAAGVAAEVLDTGLEQARLFYSDPETTLEWALGPVKDVK